jgi:hypothetical protein
MVLARRVVESLQDTHKRRKWQRSVWGRTTNGINYQVVKIQAGQPPEYFLLPELSLRHRESAVSLLQVLEAICQSRCGGADMAKNAPKVIISCAKVYQLFSLDRQ